MTELPLRTFALIVALACFALLFVLDLHVKHGWTMTFDIRAINVLRVSGTGAPRWGMGTGSWLAAFALGGTMLGR